MEFAFAFYNPFLKKLEAIARIFYGLILYDLQLFKWNFEEIK